MFVPLLLLFASATRQTAGVYGLYLSDLTDLTLPSEPHGKRAEAVFKECQSSKKHFYRDQCWDLLTRGPCEEGQWLVLEIPDYEDTPEVKCAKRKCSDPDLYWPFDGFCYDSETARRRRLCPQEGTELTTDDFGNGHCGCRRGDKVPYVRVVSAETEVEDENSLPCYPLYARGPCPDGYVLTPAGRGYGNCTANKCSEKHRRIESTRPLQLASQRQQKQLRQKQQHQQKQQLQPNHQGHQNQNRQQLEQHQHQEHHTKNVQWTDGMCYELGTQGPCDDNEQFTILQDAIRPGCINTIVELHLIKGGCLKDHTGACQDQIEIQTSSSPTQNFEQEIIDQFYSKNKNYH